MPPTMPPPPGVAPPPTMHPQRTANGIGAPGGPSYPTYPGQVPPPGPQGMVPPPGPGAPHQQPGMIQQNQQGGSNKIGGGGGQRIDPAQIPRPAHDDHAEVIRWDSRTAQGAAAHPPAASTSFIASDRGSCNPRFVHFNSFLYEKFTDGVFCLTLNSFNRYMRSTMSTIPHTGELLTSSGMPFSIMVQPLAIPSPEEDPIQVVDNGDVGPLRCVRCKASLFLSIAWAISMTSCFFYRRT